MQKLITANAPNLLERGAACSLIDERERSEVAEVVGFKCTDFAHSLISFDISRTQNFWQNRIPSRSQIDPRFQIWNLDPSRAELY